MVVTPDASPLARVLSETEHLGTMCARKRWIAISGAGLVLSGGMAAWHMRYLLAEVTLAADVVRARTGEVVRLVHARTMRSSVPDLATDLRGLMEVLAGTGKRVSSDPEEATVELERVVSEARGRLGLGHLRLTASISERLGVDAEEGITPPRGAFEEPITRGGIRVGTLSASSRRPGVPLAEDQLVGLRAVVAYCALIVEVAHARDLAAKRAAQSSIVQLASEALGTILEEDRLYKTVLVLSLELLGASGGAVLLGGEVVASLGIQGEVLVDLARVHEGGRKAWRGRLGSLHALGTPVGADGAFFLLRKAERSRNPKRPLSGSSPGSSPGRGSGAFSTPQRRRPPSTPYWRSPRPWRPGTAPPAST